MRNYKLQILILTLMMLNMLPDARAANGDKRVEKIRIAVMDLRAEGVSAKTSRAVTNMLRTNLINLNKFRVVERSQMDQIMKEQGFQQTGCTDQDCAVQVGKVLSARKMLIGEISSIGNSLLMTIRIVDVERAEAEFAEMERSPDENHLDAAVTALTGKLSNRIFGSSGERQKDDNQKGSSFFSSYPKNVPAGLAASFVYFTPTKTPFKNYYDSLSGVGFDYYYKLGYYVSAVGGLNYVQADDPTGDVSVSLNSYSIGARLGYPLFGFVYPYIGAVGRITWFSERGADESVYFTGYGGDGFAGCAFIVWRTLSLWADYSMSMVTLNDEGKSDISGTVIRGGMMYEF